MARFPKRGEIWLVNFDPSIGTEIKKTRPAVVVSNDVSNKFLERVQVVPISSNTEKVYPSESLVDGAIKGKIMTDQIMTASKKRLYKYNGKLKSGELKDLEKALTLQLGLK